jgi:hypothetical protein
MQRGTEKKKEFLDSSVQWAGTPDFRVLRREHRQPKQYHSVAGGRLGAESPCPS